ncbi:MAG: Serine/threonine kinase associate protein KapC [Acidobacteria bacterium]|nr:Serine/threonine kinase associate protein KapC [Acidobacteriota bacterium]
MNRCRLALFFPTVAVLVWAAACTKDNPTTPTAPSCSFSITPLVTTTFAAEGGTGTIAVTAGSGCAWTATSGATFVTITQGASGTSNGSVAFTVAANAGADRTAILTIAGSTVSLTQRAATSTPTGTLSAPTAKAPVGGVAVDPGRPTLVVNNAAATGTVGPVTYRFEISDTSSFPADPVRTFTVDGVAQGSGTTGWVVNHDLGANVLWYWHARATTGTVTTAYSATDTFNTGTSCTFALSPSSAAVGLSAATGTITVTTTSACSWTATSNDAFITVTTGASGAGTGTLSYTVAANSGAARTGTLTIAGQTFTVAQAGSSSSTGIVAAFQLFDPGSQQGATTECRIRSASGAPTTCTLQSTSFTLGTNAVVSYSWNVQYTYDTVKTFTGTSPTLAITDVCGTLPNTIATTDGASQPLSVSLTVTDNLGATATAISGTGSQAPLVMRFFVCGS